MLRVAVIVQLTQKKWNLRPKCTAVYSTKYLFLKSNAYAHCVFLSFSVAYLCFCSVSYIT